MPVDDDAATLLQRRLSEPPEGPRSLRVRVVAGPDSNRAFVVDAASAGRVLVGTSAACEIRLTDPSVSRRHLALDLTKGRVRVTDLGSTNGTFVEAIEVTDGYAAVGQTIGLGDTQLRVEPNEGAQTTQAAATSPDELGAFGSIIGSSAALRRLFPMCHRLAQTDVPVVIEGETGTGKEVLAESIHEQSRRAAAPFVVFDCTAVPPNLIEGELFGHERGAYTGAVTTRKGVFEEAHGGTLLIDEIGDLDLALQPKLLRAIERSQIRRIGGTEAITVDVRILAATRRDLDKEVAAGRFRDDLFHRLAVTRIELPPLRKRKSDIEGLARHFFTQLGYASALSSALVARWLDYDWPGNVRELRNACARHVALGELADHPTVPEPEEEPEGIKYGDVIEQVLAMKLPLALARGRVVDNFERRYVARVLAEHGGSVVRAAKASGIERRYLQKLKARQSG
jgi:DNA-binding NtrC family response regulator